MGIIWGDKPPQKPFQQESQRTALDEDGMGYKEQQNKLKCCYHLGDPGISSLCFPCHIPHIQQEIV